MIELGSGSADVLAVGETELAQFSEGYAMLAAGLWIAVPTATRALSPAGCCARAASGHAAAPPSAAMNTRLRW